MKDVGDIVFVKGCKDVYWIIIDIVANDNDPSVPLANTIGYEISPFYPLEDANDFIPMTVFSREITLFAKGGSKKAKEMEKTVTEELRAQKSKIKFTSVDSYTSPTKRKIRKRTSATNNDIIKYNKILSVDECLDALNDLKDLHNAFGDESYIQLREIVTKRLKELV